MAQKYYSQLMMMVQPTDPKHLTTKEYVDLVVNRKIKDAVRIVLATNFDLSDTVSTPLDGVTLAENDRVLLVGQTDATENGIYVLGSDNKFARSEDFNASEKIPLNVIIPVREGSAADSNWQLINDEAVVLGTSNLSFAKFKADADVHAAHGTFQGDGNETEFVITHGLNSKAVVVRIVDATTKEECFFNVVANSDNTVTVKSDVAPETGDEFEITILA